MRLITILKNNSISQRKLSELVGMSPAAINQLLKHDKYPATLSKEAVHELITNALIDMGITTSISWTHNKKEQELPEMQALTQAAKQLFKLPVSPFIDDVQTRGDVYLSEEQRYVRQSILMAAKTAGFLAIIGESGAGKTTLKRDLIEGINQDKDNVIIIQPLAIDKTRLNVNHLCDSIIDDISEGTENPKRSMEAKARQIKRLLTQSARAGNKHCLLIDEAHDLTIPVLKYLKRFWELEDGMRRLLSVVIIGQPELKQKLNERNADVREVARRCEQVELQPLNNHVGEYLTHKFKRIGVNFSDIFSDDAMAGLTQRLSHKTGNKTVSLLYPLIVNNAVITAMNEAAAIGQDVITADIFEGV